MGWLINFIWSIFGYSEEPSSPLVQPRPSQQQDYEEWFRQHQRQQKYEAYERQRRREDLERVAAQQIGRKLSYAEQLKGPQPLRAGGRSLAQPPPSPLYRPKVPGKREDYGENASFQTLRDQSRLEGDKMARYFQESSEARETGDLVRAGELSNRANLSRAEMDRLNAAASDQIFAKNNSRAAPNEFDLHGLYVKEAVQKAEECLYEARRRGDIRIRFIVGKGLHSPEQTARVKPAIEQLILSYGFAANLDPSNSGVIVVRLDR